MPTSTFKGSKLARTRSQVATAARVGSPDDLERAKRDHAAAKLEDYIKRTVDTAPPLTPAQRDKLALLLKGGGRHGS